MSNGEQWMFSEAKPRWRDDGAVLLAIRSDVYSCQSLPCAQPDDLGLLRLELETV
jgi:hypothetical protein